MGTQRFVTAQNDTGYSAWRGWTQAHIEFLAPRLTMIFPISP
jgi:hypothetical protein